MNQRSILFILWVIQGLGAFIWLAVLPSDAENSLLFGYSASRLVLLLLMLVLTGLSAALVWTSATKNFFRLDGYFRSSIYVLSGFIVFFAPMLILILSALGKSGNYSYTAYAERLAPPVCWLSLSALELAITLSHTPTEETGKLLKKALLIFVFLGMVAAFVKLTGLGITRQYDGSWGTPTTPLLEWQILLALGVALTTAAFESRWKHFRMQKYAGWLVYILASIIWISQPINPGYFATPPRSPNFEIYPFSDALIYAQYAQSALVGNGFIWPDVPTRPLYITFITWLHAIAGQDYPRVIVLQTLVLAVFPAILYLLGREISGHALGIGMAVLAILRDLTANVAAPFALNYTYTKLFFSEIPTALLISLFTLIIIRWINQPKPPAWYPLLAGGLLGLSALIRLQSVVLLAMVIPCAFFIVRNKQKWIIGSVLLVSGTILALVPWVARNFLATGGLVLDNPISQSMVLARRWGGNPGNDLLPHLPGENDSQYSSRMAGIALDSLRKDPGRILGSAANHFLNNEIGNLLIFPLRDQLNSPAELLWPTRAFWQSWNGQPTRGQVILILVYLVFLAVGLASAWQSLGLLGWLPLLLSLVYNAWTALFLSSGDRFLVPLDWAICLYLFLGILSLAKLFLGKPAPIRQQIETEITSTTGLSFNTASMARTAFAIIAIGATIPLTEMSFPKLYPRTEKASETITVSLHGRAIYPRWYESGEGEPGTAKRGYGVDDHSRLVFFLVGEQDTLVILPIENAPEFFPHASEVIVSGTQAAGYIDAEKVVLTYSGNNYEYQP